jgi:V/A-type H+/Na+-transporting ATPase subunit C
MNLSLSPLIGQQFAFSYGRMGTLQQHLLNQSDLDRLLGSHNTEELNTILTELPFTAFIDQGLSDAKAITSALETWVQHEVTSMAPAAHLPTFSIIYLDSDAALLSFLLKKHFSLTSMHLTEMNPTINAYNVHQLRSLVDNNEKGSLPSHLISFVEKIKALSTPQPAEIDTQVALYIANLRTRLARASGSELIASYTAHLSDLHNIRSALRQKRADEKDSHSTVFVPGGTIPKEAFQRSLKEIQSAIDRSDIAFTLTEDLLEGSLEDASLEQTLSSVIAHDISRMWNIPLRIEPLFAFAALALLQLRVLRVIVIGKRNGLSPQDIKAILPPFVPSTHYHE